MSFTITVMFKNIADRPGRPGEVLSRIPQAAYNSLSLTARTSHFRPTMKFTKTLTDERHIVLEPFNITPL